MIRRRPPRVAEWLVSLVLPSDPAGRSIVGDLAEEYGRLEGRSGRSPRLWYWRAVISLIFRRALPRARATTGSPIGGRPIPRKGDTMITRVLGELRLALRMLRRTPGFTVVATLTLAIGVGASTAIFSVVNGVLITPLPFPDADDLVGVWHTAPGLDLERFGVSPGLYVQYGQEADAIGSLAILRPGQASLTGDGDPERVRSVTASRNLLDVLQVPMLAGRGFTVDEDLPNGPQVVVISEGLRARRFGDDQDAIGRSIEVNGMTRQVVGVMPELDLRPAPAEVWLPIAFDPVTAAPGVFGSNAIGRLRPGATAGEAQEQLNTVLPRLPELYADQDRFLAFVEQGQLAPVVTSMKEDVVGDLEQPLWILLGTVGFVMLIVCANVANLFMVRAEGRRREMAVRNALGARRGTLIRQYLTESGVLAGLGGAVGVGLAWFGVPVLLRLAPSNLPRLDQVTVDGRVLAFAVVVSGVSALLFGLIPAIRNSSPRLLPALKMAGRGMSAGRDRHLFRGGLVVAQTALALVLLVGSGLLVRSFWELRQVDPGFQADDLVTFSVTLPQSRYQTPIEIAAFHDRVLERLRAIPGVLSASGVADIPFAGREPGTAHEIADRPTEAGALPPMLWYTFAAPEYFETMRIPLLAGRTFEPRDHQQTFGAVVVSDALAERLWPGEDPLGKRIRFGAQQDVWQHVIGVVGAVHSQGLRQPPTEVVYYPMVGQARDSGWAVPGIAYALRVTNPDAVTGLLRAAVWEIDSQLPITGITTMEELMADTVVEVSFTMIVLVVAALMALALGAIGLYGVLAYLVSQRRQEIGLRIALGADMGTVRNMVVRQGAQLAGIGVALGLLGAFGLTRFMQGLLFGTAAFDPLAVAVTSGTLFAVVLIASYLPARRASRVDPMEALRVE